MYQQVEAQASLLFMGKLNVLILSDCYKEKNYQRLSSCGFLLIRLITRKNRRPFFTQPYFQGNMKLRIGTAVSKELSGARGDL